MALKIMLNNKFYTLQEAAIPVMDRGYLFGDGIFETMKSSGGKVYALEKHLSRWQMAMDDLCYGHKINPDDIKKAISSTLEKNGLQAKKAYIKLIATRGRFKGELNFSLVAKPNILIITKPLKPYPVQYYRQGVKIIKSEVTRPAYGGIAYRYKLINYFENIYAKNEAVGKQAQEAIFLTEKGTVLEGATSNIFMVKNQQVYTTPLTYNILPGITRQMVIEECRHHHIKLREKKFSFPDLVAADEIFITNSIMDVMPVTSIENFSVGNKTVGPITSLMASLFTNQYPE